MPSQQRTPPTTYEQTQAKQYEKPVNLRLSPNSAEATSIRRGTKKDRVLTSKSLTTKAKKKAKRPPKEEMPAEMGIGLKY